MRKKKWFQFQTLSFTVVSNDANKDVRRFRIPKIFIFLFTFLFIAMPIVLFVHFFQTSKQLEVENANLTKDLNGETTKSNELVAEVINFKETETKVRSQLNTLYQLESQVKESMEELPVELEPSGGIDVEITEQEVMQIKDNALDLNVQTDDLIDRYHNTLDVLDKTSSELETVPTEWPVKPNEITSEFGLRTDPFRQTSSLHTGVDIRGEMGDPVISAAEGEIIQAENSGGHGNMIIIHHSDEHETMYAHLSSIDVQVGDQVKKGDVIGAVGSTGRSTGPHLHYEIAEFGEPIDPYTYLSIFDQYIEERD